MFEFVSQNIIRGGIVRISILEVSHHHSVSCSSSEHMKDPTTPTTTTTPTTPMSLKAYSRECFLHYLTERYKSRALDCRAGSHENCFHN